MFKGMKKDGLWYKIKDIEKINKSDYIRFQFLSEDFEKIMKLLKPKPKSNQVKKTTNKSS